MTKTKLPRLTKLRCARCGVRLREEQYVRSSFTKLHYCASIDVCSKRAKRKK